MSHLLNDWNSTGVYFAEYQATILTRQSNKPGGEAMFKKTELACAISAVIAASVAGGAAHAAAIEEIIVTATKRSENPKTFLGCARPSPEMQSRLTA